MRTRSQRVLLVAEIAVTGLAHSPLRTEDRADFYEGLSAILPPAASEAARYAATCIRESHQAQQDFLTALALGKGTTKS